MDYQKGYLEGVAKLLKSAGAQKCHREHQDRRTISFFLFGECLLLPSKFSDTLLSRFILGYYSFASDENKKAAFLRLELLDENKKTISSFSPNLNSTLIAEDNSDGNQPRDPCRTISVRDPFVAGGVTEGAYRLDNCPNFSRESLKEVGFVRGRGMLFVQTKQIFSYYAMIDSETIARTKEIKISLEPRK